MLTEKFREVMTKESPVSIVSWANNDAHVTATWASYIHITEDQRLLIPAAGMNGIEAQTKINNVVKMIFGHKEVMGLRTMGAGFLLEGSTRFLREGAEFDMMKKTFPWLTRVLEVTITTLTQTL